MIAVKAIIPKKVNVKAMNDAWLDEKRREGWKYGAIKDPAKKEHPCFVPYDDLPREQKMKDDLFTRTVRAIADALKR